MRIISGFLKGRRLRTPKTDSVRPTEDRVKEALFNILGSSVMDARVLDLFAGSGSIGLEFFSRGAAYVHFHDKHPQSLACIRQNLEDLKIVGSTSVTKGDFRSCIRRLGSAGECFDFIFIDPPYGQGIAEEAVQLIWEADLLCEGGRIVIETGLDWTLGPCGYLQLDERRYGSTMLRFFGKEASDDSNLPG
ncbi:MAG: 16S rRNA (guanine(966)-N(2))-methyltransferase RsmD [Tissierellia bacterium]|nr:16S rRNA (guanine(966)-N(2))-methyltransferase RsmD [Tissierellia bacterium]